jgi:multidrug transporter EmrE-like cation transporter
MKASAGMTRPAPTILLYVCFAAGATFQTLAMRQADLGVAYLFSLGLEAVLAFGFGLVFFAESATWWKAVGMVGIVAGMFLMHLGDGTPGESAEGSAPLSEQLSSGLPASMPTP